MLEVAHSVYDAGLPISSLGCYFFTVCDEPQLVANLSMINISSDFRLSYCYIFLYVIVFPDILFGVYWYCGWAQRNFMII